ncbi:MAG: LacI family DNA-binding transcriptional regulator [Brevinematia bacterium]
MILEIAKLGIPFVVIHYDENYLLNNVENTSLSVINTLDYEAGMEATEYLIARGHRKIAFLNGRLTNYSAYERFRGYLDTMKKHNLPLKKELILHGKYLKHLTEMEIKRMVESKELPTAIICCNDDMALITLNLLREYKIRVPEDISVISFDNIPLSEYTEPKLTTFNLPIYEIAEKSFETLQKLLSFKKSSTHTFPMPLIERGSVARVDG